MSWLDKVAPENATGFRRYVPGLLLVAFAAMLGGFAIGMGWLS